MVVISLTDCPAKLRGDLTKWLLEINTGVYCGQVSARVREELWKRICDNIKNGRATMVYSAPGEQHLDFKIHNTDWLPVDYDGIKLIMHPLPKKREEEKEEFVSNVEKINISKRSQKKRQVNAYNKDYCVVDLETTGLSVERDTIIEIAALKVRDNKIADRYSCLINSCDRLPDSVIKLTGITASLLKETGKTLGVALDEFREFVDNDLLIGYHINFDFSFLQQALKNSEKQELHNKQLDVLTLARKRLEDVPNYKLSTVASYLGITELPKHRALSDCLTVYDLYNKLNEK